MVLYTTPTSPYGRIVRAVAHETGLASTGHASSVKVEFINVRTPDCVLHPMNPTGRVPTLVLESGEALSEARLICSYLDGLRSEGAAGIPVVDLVPSLEARQLEGILTGVFDGIVVWVREARRPESEQSPSIIEQERARIARVLPWLEPRTIEIDDVCRYAQLVAYFALETLDTRLGQGDAIAACPAVEAWYRGHSVTLAGPS